MARIGPLRKSNKRSVPRIWMLPYDQEFIVMKGLTDIPGIRVGHVSDLDALTGCTVILCDGGAVAGVDIRGAATGTAEMDVMSPGHVTYRVHAVVFAAGSAFWLEAATGGRIAGERKSPERMELVDTEQQMKRGLRGGFRRENTTLAVVATNARLNKVQAAKLAQMAGLGMARTIYPVNTMSDGDVVIALSLGNEAANIDALGVAAAQRRAQAIVGAARRSPTMGGLPGLASLTR